MHMLSPRSLGLARAVARGRSGARSRGAAPTGGSAAARSRRGISRGGLSAAALLGACAVLAACGGSDGDRGATSAAPAPNAARSSAPMVVVPQLVGREQAEAHRVAARAGLQLRWTGFTGKLGNGRYNISCVRVLRQSPVAGERRPRGAKIAVIEAACHTPNERPHGVAPDGSTEG